MLKSVIRKYLVSFVFLFSVFNYATAEDSIFSTLKGNWALETDLPSNARCELYYKEWYPYCAGYEICEYSEHYSDDAFFGIIRFRDGGTTFFVKSYTFSDDTYILDCYEYYMSETLPINEMEKYYTQISIKIIDDTWIEMKGLGEKPLFRKSGLYYRYTNKNLTKIHRAIVNDSSVRMRTGPGLSSKCLYLLPKGKEVTILAQSEETTEIDGEEWYWYKVSTKYCIEGWMYGKYLDIDDSFINDEQEIWFSGGFRENNTYHYWHANFYYCASKTLTEADIQSLIKLFDYNAPNTLNEMNRISPDIHFTLINGEYELLSTFDILSKLESSLLINSKYTTASSWLKLQRTMNSVPRLFTYTVSKPYSSPYGITVSMPLSKLKEMFGEGIVLDSGEIEFGEKIGTYSYTLIAKTDAADNVISYQLLKEF